MGLYMEFLAPFLLWMLLFAVVGTAVFVLINKYFQYHGPEDAEEWLPGKDHFVLPYETVNKE